MKFDFHKLPFSFKKELITSKYFLTYIAKPLLEQYDDIVSKIFGAVLSSNLSEEARSHFAKYLINQKSFPKQIFSENISEEDLEKFYKMLEKIK